MKTSGEVVSLASSSRLWRSLPRLSRFPIALKLLKNRQLRRLASCQLKLETAFFAERLVRKVFKKNTIFSKIFFFPHNSIQLTYPSLKRAKFWSINDLIWSIFGLQRAKQKGLVWVGVGRYSPAQQLTQVRGWRTLSLTSIPSRARDYNIYS